MRVLIGAVGVFIFLIISCDKEPLQKPAQPMMQEETAVISCVDTRINEFSKNACEGAAVKEYLFQRKTVYVFEAGRCGADMTSEVIDASCAHLGYLGGISGNMTINGENFDNAIYQQTLWQK